MNSKARIKLLPVLLMAGMMVGIHPASMAQNITNMINNDTIVLDGCELGSGVIYDDGGALGNYNNSFNGTVIIQASTGITINISGTYYTEQCCDKITIEDGTTTLFGPLGGDGTINVSSTTGQVLIHFSADGSVTSSGFTLNWSVTGISAACSNPITSLDTTSVTTNSIGLTWSASNSAGPFTVVCNDQVFSGITSTNYTISGLNASSTYSISVSASSSIDNRCCAARMIVRTACGNASLPYSESFEGMAEGSFPSCWLQVVNFDDEDYLPQVLSSQHSSGSRSLLLSCGNSESPGHFGIVATPPLEGVGSHTVRLMLRASHYGTAVEFGTCDSAGSDYNQYNFTPIQTEYINNTNEWQEYRFTWNSTSNGRRLALRMQQQQQQGTGRRLYIDDCGIENCGVDSVRTIHVEYDRLELLWSTYGNPTCNVGVRRVGALTDTLSFSNVTSPLSITGLAADTRYTFTVYPTCGGTLNISRSVTTRTAVMPTSANGYCSNFSQSISVPPEWTFLTVVPTCGFSYYKNNRAVTISNGCGGADGILSSERLIGLAGKQVAVTYSGYNTGAMIILGTMIHPDDESTFVPLDTAYADGGRHTMTATVPTTSTGRHISIRFKNPGWYIDFTIHAVTCSNCALEEDVVLHRRGTSMEISWAQPYTSVMVQYGPHDFALGTGTVETFYNVSRGTITGLTPGTEYDFFVYRPCQTPCEDMRYTRRTATRDYPLPYCEDFELMDDNSWNYETGDWKRLRDLNGRPNAGGHPYYGSAGQALTLSSWGFDWDYYAMAMLPDVEIPTNPSPTDTTVLSFYVYDQAPQSTIIVGVAPENNEWAGEHFQVLDTIHINAQNQRIHYNYVLRPSDTLFNNRLVIAYQHPFPYSYYNCYIDELQVQHPYYGTLQCTYTSFDTATFNLTSLGGGADSVEITLDGGGQTFVDTILRSNIHSFGFGDLDTGTLYHCYVRPLSEGCTSYAGYIITTSYGNGYAYCFPFSYELSYELPYHWAADCTTLITTGDYLQLQPGGSVAMHPMTNVTDASFSFRARSSVAGDTLVLGGIQGHPSEGGPASISTDSTHFGPQIAYFSPIDTFILGTEWQTFMLRLPAAFTDTVRLTFHSGSGVTDLDEIEITWCPIVHFEVNGNSLICTLDNDQVTDYYLTISDSTGNDNRVIYVESNPYRVSGLKMGMRYDLSWYCPYHETGCRPTVSVHTGGLIPLPYCEDFNVGVGGSISVPPTWTFIKNDVNNEITLDTWGPSLRMDPHNDRWMYAVLPELDVDSVLSLHGYFYTWSQNAVEIGVMNNATDTASFIPLWTSIHGDWQQPELELSGYTNKRVAIRTRADMRLFNIHLYDYPLAKVSLIGRHHLKVTTEYPGPYWLHYQNADWWGSGDTMYYVDTTVFYIHDTTIVNSDNVYINQTDSAGFTCEDNRNYYLSSYHDLPYCGNGSDAFRYTAYNHSGVWWTYQDGHSNESYFRFPGNSSNWMVMHDLRIDSLNHLGMRVRYDAGSTLDTMVIGVMTDAYDTSTFTPIDTVVYTISDSLQSVYVDFTHYTDTGRWVTFHHLYTPESQWFDIHNVYLDKCPGALSATASLYRWNRVKIDGKAVPFYVEYGYNDMGQGHPDNTILRVDSVPIILTLDPETRYDFYFRCDSLSYNCAPKQQVTTLAAPMELPTCTDFDTVVNTLIPRNWQRCNAYIGASNTVAHSDTNSLAMPVASNSYIITPDINVDSIQKVALSLWYQVEDLSDRLVVGVMSDPADLSTFYPVRTLAPLEVGEWQHGMVEFGNAPTESHFIALRARSNRQGGGRNIYVDDIYVTDCAAFDFTVQRLTNSSIDLTWSHRGNPNITVTVEDDGVLTGTYTNVTPPLHIEPLDMLHYYTFHFQSTCGDTITTDIYCTTDYEDSLSVVTPAAGTGCVNPTDLASPQAVFFTGSYRNPYSQAGAINYGSLHPDSRHTVCYDTAQRDPRTGNQLRTIPVGYTSSVRLGNWSTNYFTPEAEGVIYSLFVDTASFELLLLRYAAVLQDPQHATSDQPRFRMELLDTNYNIIDSACTSADFIADQNLGWHTAEDGVLWKDWTAVGIDLSSHAGQQVYFRLTTYDCNEGSHYGYAYFTLECMRKNMNTVSCGDVDSNTLSAPEGFHYRWYTSQSNATVSTEQNITVASEDITYYCDVSKIDNDNCRFTISAYGGTRYPMADFDTTVVLDSCVYHINFINTSGVSKDGVNLIPGEHCETTYWDFGNGTSSTNYHGYAEYPQPGTYTVRLISGIGMDACQDTMEMVLNLGLPADMPADTTLASICDNQHYFFHNQFYAEEGTHLHLVPIENSTCDSLYVLMLDVRPTTHGDTVAVVCDSLLWRGTLYDTTGIYTSNVVGLNSVGCDSTRVLQLTVNYSQETNDDRIICPGYPFLYLGVDYGAPTAFDMMFRTRANCDSLVHVTLMARDSNYHLMTLFRFDSTEWQVPDSMLRSCDPTTLDLLDTTQGAAAWNWTLFMADTQATSIDSTVTYRFEQGQKQLLAYINLIVTDTLGCYDTVGWPVFVFPSSIPEFRWEPEVPALHNPETQFINLTQPDTVTYLWHIQQVEGGEFDTTSVAAPFYHWGEPDQNMAGEYEVRLDAMWQHFVDPFRLDSILWIDSTLRTTYLYKGFSHTCIDSVTHTVVITNDFLQFPNLVTPNGDGVNDTWVIVNLLEFGNYSMNELWIYDRTGAQVYHVRDIRRPEQFWDPKATRSPDGTYYYRFMAKGEYGLVKRNGLIEVIH